MTIASDLCPFAGESFSRPRLPVEVLPWLEVMDLDRATLEHAVAGLRAWRRITGRAVVSTLPGCSLLYEILRYAVPGVEIMPGLTTHPRLEAGLTDIGGWSKIARDVEEIFARTGKRRILLENEITCRPYTEGKEQLDLGRFRECIEALPVADYCWYPSVWGSDLNRENHRLMCTIAVKGLSARLTGHCLSDPASWRFAEQRAKIKKMHDHLVASLPPERRPALELIHVGGINKWLYEGVPEALQGVRELWGDAGVALLYPGRRRWIEAALAVSGVYCAADRGTESDS